MKLLCLLGCFIAFVTSARTDDSLVTFNLTYVDGNTRQLKYVKRDFSECIYTDRTKELICMENQLYRNVVNMWTKLPDTILYVRVNCLGQFWTGRGNGLCICKSAGTGNIATEPYTYCHLTSLSMGSFNYTHNVETLDVSDNQLSSFGSGSFLGLRNLKYISLARNPLYIIPFGLFCDNTLLEYIDISQLKLDVFPSHAFVCKSKLDKIEAIDLSNSGIKDVPSESLDNLPSLKSLNLGENQLVEIYKSSFDGGVSLKHLNLSHNVITYMFPYFCDYLPKLTSLHLRGNRFDKFLFEEMSNCSMVEVLDLSFNQIRYFSGSSSKMVSLQVLNISSNKIKHLNFSLEMSKDLRWLDASANEIFEIIDNFVASNIDLEYFNLSHNALNSSANFGVIFNNTVDLNILDLSHNQLTDIPAFSFMNLRSLTHLHLDFNSIGNLDGHSFSGLPLLKYLSLSHNNLRSLPMSIFNDLTSLRHVTLSYNKLASVEANFWPRLRTLSLNNNMISRVSTIDFSQMEILNLSNNKLSEFVGSDENTFINFQKMISLDLSFNNISDISPRLFESSKNLQSLNLEHNQLSFNISLEFLSNVKHLTDLNLASNNFEEVGELFSNETLKNITHLNLSHNKLRRVYSLAKGATSSNLKTLDLSYCDITYLEQDVFYGLPELEFVNLAGNAITTFPAFVANENTIFDFTYNPIICSCNMSWLLGNWVDVSIPERMRIATHNYHVPLCKVYTEPNLANPTDLYRRQFMCEETQNCDHRCTCYKTEESGPIQSVICRNSLHSVPAVISSTALSLFLDRNSFVSNNSLSTFLTFSDMSAKQIYLNKSGINTLDSRTFKAFTFLEILSLAENNLNRLPSDIFLDKKRLKQLYLNGNRIHVIEPGVFEILPALTELDISSNILTVLSGTTVSELSYLKRMTSLYLSNNPWACNCSNAALKDFIDNVKFKIRDRQTLYCAGTNEDILYQTQSVFTCTYSDVKRGNPFVIIVILVAALLLILLIAVMVYFRREVASLINYYTGYRIPSRKRIPETHFDCFLSYDPLDQHCANYVQRTLQPELRNNGYCIQSSTDIIQDVEVTRKVIEDSRCSLFIIDQNFTTNPFYVKVFQMSLDRRKHDDRFHVILLILGDIDLIALQPEVMKRMRRGDYVTARSRLWWQRLVYELPKPSRHSDNENDTISESDAIVFSSLNEDVNV